MSRGGETNLRVRTRKTSLESTPESHVAKSETMRGWLAHPFLGSVAVVLPGVKDGAFKRGSGRSRMLMRILPVSYRRCREGRP